MSFVQNDSIEMLMPGCDTDVKVELDDYAIIALVQYLFNSSTIFKICATMSL